MKFETNELLREISKIPEVQQMKASASSALTCAAFVGASTFLGGLLGGRTGLTIGGVVGSVVAGSMASQNLQPVPLIIVNMTSQDKVKLAFAIRELAKKNAKTISEFILKARNNRHLLEMLLAIIITYLSSNLGMEVTQLAH